MPMTRALALLLLPAVLAGCPLETMVSGLNQLTLTPDPGTFSHLDCDGSGKLSFAEVSSKVFVRTKALPNLHQVTSQEFQNVDDNKDGGWSYEEFKAGLLTAEAWSVSPAACGAGSK